MNQPNEINRPQEDSEVELPLPAIVPQPPTNSIKEGDSFIPASQLLSESSIASDIDKDEKSLLVSSIVAESRKQTFEEISTKDDNCQQISSLELPVNGALKPEMSRQREGTSLLKEKEELKVEKEEEEKKEVSQPPPPQCSICTEDLLDIKAVIDCGHFFCTECISKWAQIENTCPYCKQEFTKITQKVIAKMDSISSESKQSLGMYKRRQRLQGGLHRTSTNNRQGTGMSLRSRASGSGSQANIEGDTSEVIKVIEVKKRKQRVNEDYLGVDDVDDEDEYDSEDYYDEEDDDLDIDQADDIFAGIASDNGFSQQMLNQIALAMAPSTTDNDANTQANNQFVFILRYLLASVGEGSANDARYQVVLRYVNTLSNQQIDILAFEAVRFFLHKRYQVRKDNWDGIMIIPERMVPVLAETTHGQVTKLPSLQRLCIVKYCINSLETFNITFPFISADEDLDMNQQADFYIHVIDMPVYQPARNRNPLLQFLLSQEIGNLGRDYRRGGANRQGNNYPETFSFFGFGFSDHFQGLRPGRQQQQPIRPPPQPNTRPQPQQINPGASNIQRSSTVVQLLAASMDSSDSEDYSFEPSNDENQPGAASGRLRNMRRDRFRQTRNGTQSQTRQQPQPSGNANAASARSGPATSQQTQIQTESRTERRLRRERYEQAQRRQAESQRSASSDSDSSSEEEVYRPAPRGGGSSRDPPPREQRRRR